MTSFRKHAGFTLLEVMIVLSIIASLMAIAWPRLRGMSDRAELREASLEIKRVLAEARERAVNEGIEVRFVFQLGSTQYRIEPESTYIPPSDGLSVSASNSSDTLNDADLIPARSDTGDQLTGPAFVDQDLDGMLNESRIGDTTSRRLPDSIAFVSAATIDGNSLDQPFPSTGTDEIQTDELDVNDLVSVGTIDIAEAQAAGSIPFYPDGRSQTNQIHLHSSELNSVITIKVRGLTGSVSIGPTETTEPEEETLGENATEENNAPLDSIESPDSLRESFDVNRSEEAVDDSSSLLGF